VYLNSLTFEKFKNDIDFRFHTPVQIARYCKLLLYKVTDQLSFICSQWARANSVTRSNISRVCRAWGKLGKINVGAGISIYISQNRKKAEVLSSFSQRAGLGFAKDGNIGNLPESYRVFCLHTLQRGFVNYWLAKVSREMDTGWLLEMLIHC